VKKSPGPVILSPPCFSAGEGSLQLLFGFNRLQRTAEILRFAQDDRPAIFSHLQKDRANVA
jgi:hypothetical protein